VIAAENGPHPFALLRQKVSQRRASKTNNVAAGRGADEGD